MSLDAFYNACRFNDEPARRIGYNPYYPLIQGGLLDPLRLDDRDFINLASNNYLGLAMDPRVKAAAAEGLERYGVSLCSTPVAAGYSELFQQSEKCLSGFENLEDAIILPSCYQANNGIFRVIAREDDLIIVDRSAHSSLIEGIRSATCKFRPFLNNNMDHLEEILKKSDKYAQVFVVTESVFSTEGSIAPFGKINELCMKYGAIPVVDDSHGIGILGKQGRGTLEFHEIHDYQGIYLASLGKALAVMGGMIAGKHSLMDFLRYNMPHTLYSTAIIPAALQAVIKVIRIIEAEYEELSDRLYRNTQILRDALTSQGYRLTPGSSPIVSIKSGDTHSTLVLAKAMYKKDILGTPFVYPSVAADEGRIRLIAGAGLGNDSLQSAITAFGEIRNELL